MQNYSLLDQINEPADLQRLTGSELPELCYEIREFLISNVSKTGGHLASNLGVVELTVAAHRVFSRPEDSIMFDVGHQCYVHKILTGRKDRFPTLRAYGGMSGFLRPDESPSDCFVSGHASNSISASLGMIRAKRLQGQPGRVVCVIGDGAMTGGMAYEALNDAGQSGQPLIIIYNDNEMSIGKNVGALSKRLNKIRLKPRYFRAKYRTKDFFSRFPWGEKAISGISGLKRRVRTAILKESLFEIMGFKYLGPADGHDVNLVSTLLEEAARYDEPVVVHLKTTKGKGYARSEQHPDEYHGVAAFDPAEGTPRPRGGFDTFSEVFGRRLSALAGENDKICAVTAAMEYNTGLRDFAARYPDRFFDVGIAEGHAVTMAAGMASAGMRPVFAVYSTFLQRGYDQLIHDVAIQGYPVVFAIDRAGVVGADGQTHQGVFDVNYLLSVPGMTVYAPSSFRELERALELALAGKGPCAVRYPRGKEGAFTDNTFDHPAVRVKNGGFATVVTYGIMINSALSAAAALEKKGYSLDVIKLNCLSRLDMDMIAESVARTGRLIVLEDCVAKGGMGEVISARLAQRGMTADIRLLNLRDDFIPEGDAAQIHAAWGIDADGVIRAAESMMQQTIRFAQR